MVATWYLSQIMALIFDLTTVATWTRQVVGVVRIERELPRWAAAHCDADLIFACHDAAADRVFSLPRDGARAIIAAEIRVEPPRPPASFRARLHQAMRHPR